MQSLTAFYEDNKLLASMAAVAVVVLVLAVVFLLYRLLFGRPLRTSAAARNRQPRLGIVDAYDLDRQRQLVLVRRDNVEHLIMIGGPTDVVVESSIVRTQAAAPPRDKDAGGPLIGTVTPPGALPATGAQASLAAAPQAAALPPAAAARTEPTLAPRGEPNAAPRGEPLPPAVRTEPSLGAATPMPSPAVERAPVDRGPQRPIAVPDPAAPAGPPQQAEPGLAPPRPAPARPAGLPPRPATAQAQPSPGPTPGPSAPQAAGPVPERPAVPRPPLPPRPTVQRPPLPPRPNLASSLPPRPTRPLPTRPEPVRPEQTRTEGARPEPAAPPSPPAVANAGPGTEPEPRVARGPETPPGARTDAPAAPTPPRTIETLESLEEEMAKLLGRPAPRRDG